MRYQLIIKAELSNATDLQVEDSPSEPFEYAFQIQCIGCREIRGNNININIHENHEITGSKGEASLVFKCRSCKKEHSAIISKPKDTALTTEDEDGKVMLNIDSRGLYFLKFFPTEGSFTVNGTTGTQFTEIDLEEGDWYDYDEDAKQEVSITNVSFDLKVTKVVGLI